MDPKRYQKFFESSVLKIYKELPHIVKVLQDNKIEFVIIGGISARSLKLKRETEDIDLLIAVEDKEKFLNLVDKGYHSFKKKLPTSQINFKWIGDEKVDVDVLFSKTPYNQGKIKYDDPQHLLQYIGDYPFLKIESFIKYKLMTGVEANRLNDLSDVQKIIGIWDLPRNFVEHLKIDKKYKKQYLSLWDNQPSEA